MEMNNKAVVIFADVQQDIPVYLCMDENGGFYLCSVGKKDRSYVEQDIKSVSCIDAQVFVADACNKARKIISERMSEVEK